MLVLVAAALALTPAWNNHLVASRGVRTAFSQIRMQGGEDLDMAMLMRRIEEVKE